MNSAAPSLSDRLRIEAYLARLDWHLDGRVAARRRREIRRELRANLGEGSAHEGSARALRGMGAPAELARTYLEGEEARLDFRRGALAALVTNVALNVVNAAIFFGFQQGLGRAGGAVERWSYAYEPAAGFGPFAAGGAGDRIFEIAFLTPAHVATMLLAFAIGSRAWRALPRERARVDA